MSASFRAAAYSGSHCLASMLFCCIIHLKLKTFSFSWSAAIQLPVLELCKGSNGTFPFDAMSKLYLEELSIAAASAKGEYEHPKGQGDHVGNLSGTKRPISRLKGCLEL